MVFFSNRLEMLLIEFHVKELFLIADISFGKESLEKLISVF